jgi:hypothetical protein
MFASGLLRDRRDLQQQMRKDALCFAGNRNNTVETSTISKQSTPTTTLNTDMTVVAPLPPPITTRLSNKKLPVVPPNE